LFFWMRLNGAPCMSSNKCLLKNDQNFQLTKLEITQNINNRRQALSLCHNSLISKETLCLDNRPVTRGALGGEVPCEFFRPTWKNLLDIAENYWT